MATTTRLNNASVLNQPHKAYVTTGAFADAIFSYSVSTNFTGGEFVTTGTLTALGASVVTSTYNVAGTVLRENGKQLIPGVNPTITQYYVGVYHPVFGSGYINPNGPLFALYNSDKANYLYNGTDLLENDLGPPVVTAGSVAAAGGITSSSSTAGVGYSAGAGSAPAAQASPATCDTICGVVTFSDNVNNGATAFLTVANAYVKANDVVVTNYKGAATDNVTFRVVRVVDGTFVIAFTNNTGANITADFSFNFAVIKSVAA